MKTQPQIRIMTVMVATLSVVARVLVFVVSCAELVAGDEAGGKHRTRNAPEMTFAHGETTVRITHSTNGKMTAIISGNGAMSDEERFICSRDRDVTYRSSITRAVIEDGVTHIGAYAFARCDSLISVEIPNSVTTIGKHAFGSSGLTSVVIPNGVTSIESEVFLSCDYLTSVTIPNTVTSIGDDAFSSCSRLPTITIPNSVTSIEKGAFSWSTNFPSITIPNSVTSIGSQAFYVNRLVSVTSLNRVPPKIGDIVFEKIDNGACLYVPKGSIAAYRAADGWKDFDCVKDLESAKSDYSFEDGAVFNGEKNELIRCPRYKSGAYVIPGSVTTIGKKAFASCDSRTTSVTIPAAVTDIGDRTFRRCSGLTSINVEPANAHYSSEDGVLFNKDKTILIQYPKSKKGAYTIPGSVIKIEDRAFELCEELTSVTIPNTVTSIGDEMFSNCAGLTSVTIPGSVKTIGFYAFFGCTALTSVTISGNMAKIDSLAFRYCDNLLSINVKPGNIHHSSENGVLFNKNKTVLIQYPAAKKGAYAIPKSVVRIEDCAFEQCSSLTSVTIPNSVTSIGKLAFSLCRNLKTVTIPNSVTSIGKSAFMYCFSLTTITVQNSIPPDISSVADDYKIPCLYVPKGSVDAYRATQWGKEFKCIKEIP